LSRQDFASESYAQNGLEKVAPKINEELDVSLIDWLGSAERGVLYTKEYWSIVCTKNYICKQL